MEGLISPVVDLGKNLLIGNRREPSQPVKSESTIGEKHAQSIAVAEGYGIEVRGFPNTPISRPVINIYFADSVSPGPFTL
jgi:hypothetical protein